MVISEEKRCKKKGNMRTSSVLNLSMSVIVTWIKKIIYYTLFFKVRGFTKSSAVKYSLLLEVKCAVSY